MRTAFIPSDLLLNNYEMLPLNLTTAAIMLIDLMHNVATSINPSATNNTLFNILIDPSAQHLLHYATIAAAQDNYAQLQFIDSYTGSLLYGKIFLHNLPVLNTAWLSLCLSTNQNWNLLTTLLVMYIIAILWQGVMTTLNIYNRNHTQSTRNIFLLMFIWVFASLDKLESTEEAVSLAILWPWCFLIIFTHLIALTDHTILFGFSEWGLPVTYGLIMLAEHCWTMGTYIFIYLAGTRGRKFSLLVALEDIVALMILVARVLLQAVRGVIVGMFHFISRELLWNMSKFWTANTQTPAATQAAEQATPAKYFILDMLSTGLLAGSSFVVITGIMFLQLIFLLVSVWLFCKCWFISWRKC